jgi:hypothetical protein
MYERRWPLIAAVIVATVVAAGIGWAIGRGTASDGSAGTQESTKAVRPVNFVDGIPVGVQRSRAGALAAADNYVAIATETAIPDPERYEQLVRGVYAPAYRATALREGQEARERSPELVDAYANGRKGVAVVVARRLDTFAGDHAEVTTWRAGVVWSSTDKPFSQWFLTESSLLWDGQRWVVEKMDDARRPAPSPPIRYLDREGLRASTFERELRGMTAPIYGAAK